MVNEINNILENINSKLGVLIALGLEEKLLSLNKKIKMMSESGMGNQEISKILGISPIHVAKEKSLLKKKNG